jgi:hypothetical protein
VLLPLRSVPLTAFGTLELFTVNQTSASPAKPYGDVANPMVIVRGVTVTAWNLECCATGAEVATAHFFGFSLGARTATPAWTFHLFFTALPCEHEPEERAGGTSSSPVQGACFAFRLTPTTGGQAGQVRVVELAVDPGLWHPQCCCAPALSPQHRRSHFHSPWYCIALLHRGGVFVQIMNVPCATI